MVDDTSRTGGASSEASTLTDARATEWMAQAIEIGHQGDPSPNPHVGAVIVKDGQIIATGFHASAGDRHAEIVALEQAGERARGATLYVTLEPCNHFGKTPPCTDAIIKAGIARVVAGCADPNPNVAGGGVAKLRGGGVEVVTGVLANPCKALIRPWRKYITQGTAYLTLKLATSLDGRIATKTGASKWITSPDSRARGHRLRAAHDAVLVGVSTIVADDPQLTVREGPPARNPIRVIVDSTLRIPLGSTVVTTAAEVPTCVVTTPNSSVKAEEALAERGVNVVRVAANTQGRCDMKAALRALAQREVVSVLCEGGAELAGSLLADQLAEELHFFIAPVLLGPRGRPCAVDWAGPDDVSAAPRLHRPKWDLSGTDAYLTGRVRYPSKPIEDT
ncbi:MAG TPA: bifunctional diaminohydroxyphosphoribosylaminopyrimidine deaminase/5-amino-6-(5-phosphoribosylamino)uracil reductase RibD [Polyangiaceae bacterium]|nr:bifunctional diaminohydroxyphosphoribosylaminopyrimidine deaminase/5-amino-6-(5-phosphoribosylamino)uracil reductase RibD [Polyangiaceae bacterium]